MAAGTPSTNRLGDLKSEETVFFLCDMQEKFRPAIQYFEEIVEVAKRLVLGSSLLGIPLIVTEQYSKGLGHTVSELDVSHAAGVFDKTVFSMMIPEVQAKLDALNKTIKHVVLFGIETHVCVQQTVIDLLKQGIEVHVVADACSSRSQMDRKFAFEVGYYSETW